MPLPLGHAVIGFATHRLRGANGPRSGRWKTLLGIVILSNLPDVDVVFGIVFRMKGGVRVGQVAEENGDTWFIDI